MASLHWRHDDHDGVSNHQPHGCLLNRLFGRRSKKTSKLRVTGLCAGNSPGPVNSPHKGPVTRKCFPLMTSSWSQRFPHYLAFVTGIQWRKHLTKGQWCRRRFLVMMSSRSGEIFQTIFASWDVGTTIFDNITFIGIWISQLTWLVCDNITRTNNGLL